MSEILKLANEMKESGAGSTGEGFTLAEVQSVAGEIGLDPDSIAAAAAKFDKVRQGVDPNQPNQYHFDRDIPYVVSDAGWERMIDQLRVNTGATGTIRERADGSREWSNIGDETIIATLTDDGATTRFELNVNRARVATFVNVAFWFLIGFSAILGTAISSKGGFTVEDCVVLTLVVGFEFALILSIMVKARKASNLRLEDLVDKLEATAVPKAQAQGEALSPRSAAEGDQIQTNS